MKRGTIDHPKMRALVAAMPVACSRYEAVGILECIWHFTALYAYTGDIGKYSDAAIAEWVGWRGSPESLIEALVKTRWLERVEDQRRLVVHDWTEHCDDSVKKRLARDAAKSVELPDPSGTCPECGETCPDMSRHICPRARAKAMAKGSKTSSSGDSPVQPELPGTEKTKGFKSWSKDDFRAAVSEANHDGMLTPVEVEDFCAYWFEPSDSGREKFKMEKTWDTRRRMQTSVRMVYTAQRVNSRRDGTPNL